MTHTPRPIPEVCKGYICACNEPQSPLCPLHDAAPELLAAAKNVVCLKTDNPDNLVFAQHLLNIAIAKAESTP